MSSLLAINPDAIESRHQLRVIKSHIGQNRQFFLSELPPSLIVDIKNSRKITDEDKYYILTFLESIQKENAMYRLRNISFDKSNFLSSIQKILASESRLELVISNKTINEKIKSFDDLDNSDLHGPRGFSGKFTPEDVWTYIEFYIKTSKRLAIVSRHNNLLSKDAKKLSRFYWHLVKILDGIQNSACYELKIYTGRDKNYDEQENLSLIESNLKKALGRGKLPQYGIHYYICEENNLSAQGVSLHERHIVTNYVVLNLNDDLGGGAANQGIQVSTDTNIDARKRDFWLENNHGLKVVSELHLTR